MDRLWEWGRPALVREVVDDLHRDRPLAYTTVMTVMENLYRKGWLRRERDGRAWRYEPTRSRSAYTAALMNDALGTSTDRRTALAHFVLQMSPHDVTLLQQALDQARGDPDRPAVKPGAIQKAAPPEPSGRRRLPVTIAAVLLAYAVGVATLGARMLARASWTARAPLLAILTYLAAAWSVVAALGLVGLTLAVHATALGGALSQLIGACVLRLRATYATPGGAAVAGAGARPWPARSRSAPRSPQPATCSCGPRPRRSSWDRWPWRWPRPCSRSTGTSSPRLGDQRSSARSHTNGLPCLARVTHVAPG